MNDHKRERELRSKGFWPLRRHSKKHEIWTNGKARVLVSRTSGDHFPRGKRFMPLPRILRRARQKTS